MIHKYGCLLLLCKSIQYNNTKNIEMCQLIFYRGVILCKSDKKSKKGLIE